MPQEKIREIRMARPLQLSQGTDVPGRQGPAVLRGEKAMGSVGHRPSVAQVVLAAHQKAVFRQKAGGLVIAADVFRDPVDQMNDPPGRPLRGPLQSVDGAAVPGGGIVEVCGTDHGSSPFPARAPSGGGRTCLHFTTGGGPRPGGFLQKLFQKDPDLGGVGLGLVLDVLQQSAETGVIRNCPGQHGGLGGALLGLLKQGAQGGGQRSRGGGPLPLGSIAPAGDEKIGGGQAAELPLLVGGEGGQQAGGPASAPPGQLADRPQSGVELVHERLQLGDIPGGALPETGGRGGGLRRGTERRERGLDGTEGLVGHDPAPDPGKDLGRSERPRSDSC